MSLSSALNTKIFNHVHGNNLVYNICWEDPRIDHQMLNLGPDDNVLVITSAGCNALDYILKGCNHVYAVDMNYRQNAVLELKKSGGETPELRRLLAAPRRRLASGRGETLQRSPA